MAKKERAQPVPEQSTVLTDHFGVGDRWGWDNEKGDHYASGEAVSHDADTQSSYMALRWPTAHGRPTNE